MERTEERSHLRSLTETENERETENENGSESGKGRGSGMMEEIGTEGSRGEMTLHPTTKAKEVMRSIGNLL